MLLADWQLGHTGLPDFCDTSKKHDYFLQDPITILQTQTLHTVSNLTPTIPPPSPEYYNLSPHLTKPLVFRAS